MKSTLVFLLLVVVCFAIAADMDSMTDGVQEGVNARQKRYFGLWGGHGGFGHGGYRHGGYGGFGYPYGGYGGGYGGYPYYGGYGGFGDYGYGGFGGGYGY